MTLSQVETKPLTQGQPWNQRSQLQLGFLTPVLLCLKTSPFVRRDSAVRLNS